MKPLSRAELRAALVDRRSEDHKGVFGHLLIVGGSRGMMGAPILAARAALRSGVGLVTLALPAGLQNQAAAAVPEALTLGLAETPSGVLRAEGVARLKTALKERGYTALAIGPGLSQQAEAAKFVIGALCSLPVPAVIDADALNALAAQEPAGVRELLRRRRAPCVLTPHPGEMARCLKVTRDQVRQKRDGCAQRLAREWGAVTLLKGHRTVVASEARIVVNLTGGPGLSKGGTGDVLTGLIAGLWAQMLASRRVDGDSAFMAAALGAHLHGLAGDLAEREKTAFAMTAGDVIAALPAAFAQLI